MTTVVAMASVTPVPGKPNLLLGAYDIAGVGYTAGEYFISGAARAYGEGPLPEAEYTTRIVALTPTDSSAFNGTVLVEWLNVSGGIDAPAVWFMAHREMIREGYAYIAVSAQKVGVDGGLTITGFDMSLKTQNPQRYTALNHPGDAYSYDMFTQVGRLVRDAPEAVLGRLTPEFVVAIGESQSAMFLTTYINAVDHHAKIFDGFLVHSRFGGAAPLDGINTLASFEKGTVTRRLSATTCASRR